MGIGGFGSIVVDFGGFWVFTAKHKIHKTATKLTKTHQDHQTSPCLCFQDAENKYKSEQAAEAL